MNSTHSCAFPLICPPPPESTDETHEGKEKHSTAGCGVPNCISYWIIPLCVSTWNRKLGMFQNRSDVMNRLFGLSPPNQSPLAVMKLIYAHDCFDVFMSATASGTSVSERGRACTCVCSSSSGLLKACWETCQCRSGRGKSPKCTEEPGPHPPPPLVPPPVLLSSYFLQHSFRKTRLHNRSYIFFTSKKSQMFSASCHFLLHVRVEISKFSVD